jgi:hypothetical protein
MAAIYSNGGNRWNIFGFNFSKRDALSSVYKISMGQTNMHVAINRLFKRVINVVKQALYACQERNITTIFTKMVLLTVVVSFV